MSQDFTAPITMMNTVAGFQPIWEAEPVHEDPKEALTLQRNSPDTIFRLLQIGLNIY